MMNSKSLLTGTVVTGACLALLAACGGGGEEGENTAPGWTTPVTLSVVDGDADGPSLVAGGDGEVAVAWSQYDDTLVSPAYTLWLRYGKDGSSWSAASSLATAASPARRPRLFMSATGDNRISWPGLTNLASGLTPSCTQFRKPATAGAAVTIDPAWICVSETGASQMMAASYDQSAGSNLSLVAYANAGVVKALYGGTAGAYSGTTITLSGAGTATQAQLLRLPGNHALVIWCENGLLTSRRFDGTSWTAAAQASGCVDKNLLLAVSADGTKVVAAGQKNYKGELHVWRYDTGSNAWSDTGDGSLPYPHDSSYAPALAIDNTGRILLAWADYDSGSSRRSLWASVGTRSYVLGVLMPINNWSEPVRLDNAALGDVAYPQLAMDSQGNAYAVWTQHDVNGWDLYARRFKAASAAWAGIEALDTRNDDVYKPQLVFDSKDKAIVAWGFVKGRYDDAVSGIRAMRHK